MILVTGGTGFVGKSLISGLLARDFQVKATSRKPPSESFPIEIISTGDLLTFSDWESLFSGVTTIVHTAARVHIMNDTAADPLNEHRKQNVYLTKRLAEQAVLHGVKRFIYLSSIKVNGERTEPGDKFHVHDVPNPIDPYGQSKLEAESALLEINQSTSLETVIIRPPLIYGPGVKANFLKMMKTIHKGIPLPFGAAHNARSMVYIENLIDLIITTVESPSAANSVFLVSDGQDLSTAKLIEQISLAFGRPPRLLNVPVGVLKLIGKVSGKSEIFERLLGNLQVEISETTSALNWTPPISAEEGIRRTVESYLRKNTE